MKALIKNESNVVYYLFEDSAVVASGDQTAVGDPVQYYISDLNDSNSTIVENLTPPDDWDSQKYTYDEQNGWLLNSDYEPYVPSEAPSEPE